MLTNRRDVCVVFVSFLSCLQSNRFKSQPNDLSLTSQNPYISGLGAPDAWTVSIDSDAHTVALNNMRCRGLSTNSCRRPAAYFAGFLVSAV